MSESGKPLLPVLVTGAVLLVVTVAAFFGGRRLVGLARPDGTADPPNRFGLFIGIELVRDGTTKVPDPEAVAAVQARAFAGGVIVAVAGRYEQVVKISPPLTIDEGQLDEAVDVVIGAVRRGR